MKKLIGLALLLLFASSSSFAMNKEGPSLNEQQLMTEYFGMFASTLGCPKLTHATFSTINLGELEYLSKDESPYNWTKTLSVTVQMLPQDPTLLLAALNSYNATLTENIARQGQLIETSMRKARDGTPVTYLEYKAASGAATERGIIVFGRHTPAMAASAKYVVRFGVIDDQARSTMRQLADVLIAR